MPANHHATAELMDQPTDIPQVGLAIITGSANWGLAFPEDVQVDGERLEGVGVTPTIEVQAGPGSDDPQLSRAVAVLSGT